MAYNSRSFCSSGGQRPGEPNCSYVFIQSIIKKTPPPNLSHATSTEFESIWEKFLSLKYNAKSFYSSATDELVYIFLPPENILPTFIVFRGTQSAENWIIDAEFETFNVKIGECNFKVHKGKVRIGQLYALKDFHSDR